VLEWFCSKMLIWFWCLPWEPTMGTPKFKFKTDRLVFNATLALRSKARSKKQDAKKGSCFSTNKQELWVMIGHWLSRDRNQMTLWRWDARQQFYWLSYPFLAFNLKCLLWPQRHLLWGQCKYCWLALISTPNRVDSLSLHGKNDPYIYTRGAFTSARSSSGVTGMHS